MNWQDDSYGWTRLRRRSRLTTPTRNTDEPEKKMSDFCWARTVDEKGETRFCEMADGHACLHHQEGNWAWPTIPADFIKQ